MSAKQRNRATGLGVFSVVVMALAMGAWTLPSGAENAVEDQAFSIDINVPLNEIQDGQFCQAYALVYNGTSPYKFTWSGQFDNSYGSTGPLGTDQIVSGYIDEAGRGSSLTLKVSDDAGNSDEKTVSLNIGTEYNSECEA